MPLVIIFYISRMRCSHFAGVVNGIACYYWHVSGCALHASVRIAQVTFFVRSLTLFGTYVLRKVMVLSALTIGETDTYDCCVIAAVFICFLGLRSSRLCQFFG